MRIEQITERIERILSNEDPLSSDVFIFKGDEETYIYDTGSLPENAEYIKGISGRKNLIISHFHRDHTYNLEVCELGFSKIYASAYTFKHLRNMCQNAQQEIVTKSLIIKDGIELNIMPIPSSHAKGSMGIVAMDRLFIGDGAYPRIKDGVRSYNPQLLREEIRVLKEADASYVCMDHRSDCDILKSALVAFLTMSLDNETSRSDELAGFMK